MRRDLIGLYHSTNQEQAMRTIPFSFLLASMFMASAVNAQSLSFKCSELSSRTNTRLALMQSQYAKWTAMRKEALRKNTKDMDLKALKVALAVENSILQYAKILEEIRGSGCRILENIDRDERSAGGLLADVRYESLSLANRR